MAARLLVLAATLTLVAPSPVAVPQRNMSQWRAMAKSQIQKIWQRLKADQASAMPARRRSMASCDVEPCFYTVQVFHR